MQVATYYNQPPHHFDPPPAGRSGTARDIRGTVWSMRRGDGVRGTLPRVGVNVSRYPREVGERDNFLLP